MSRRTVLVGSLILVSLGILGYRVWYVPKTFIPTELANRYREAHPPGQLEPGWAVRSVGRRVDRATRLVHRVEVTPELAGELLMMPAGQRRDVVGRVACPEGGDPIWQELTRRQDIEIELMTDQGPFAVVSCRGARPAE